MNQLPKEVTISVTMNADAAMQFAQFCKRSTFSAFYSYTEAHLSEAERKKLAYQMIDGLEAVQRGLSEAGISPR